MEKPTLDELLRAYERSLVAKVQLGEFTSWGEGITGAFKQTIANHAQLEKTYLDALREARQARQ
jgi:hypothetical protein